MHAGKDTARPAFKEMLDEARRRKFDVLLVWKLDRLSRTLKDFIGTLDELGHLGIDFISYDNKIDTSSPTGKLVFQIIGAVVEFERNIISERVKAGLRNAKRMGKRLGRPPISPMVIEKARKLRAEGLSYRRIGKKLNKSEGRHGKEGVEIMITDLKERQKRRKDQAIKKLLTEGMTTEELDYWEPRIPELKWDNIRRDLKSIEDKDRRS